MASSAVHLDGGSGASNPTGFTTASVTPTSTSLQLMTITIARGSSTQPTAPTVPGFTQQGSAVDYDTGGTSRASKFLYRAIGSSLSPGTITVTFGYTAQNYAYEWDEIPNVPTTGTNGADAIAQHAQNNGSSTTPNATLAAFGAAANGTYASVGAQAVPAGTAEGTGFTLLGKHSNTATVTVCSISEHRDDNDTSPDANLNSSNAWGIDALEIVFSGNVTASPSATTLTITATAPTATGTASTTPAAAVVTVTAPNPTGTGSGAGDANGFPDSVGITVNAPNPSGSGATAGNASPTPVILTARSTSPFTYTFAPGDAVYTATLYPSTDLAPSAAGEVLRIVGGSLSWEEQLSEPGSGAWTIMNDMTQPEKGQLVQMAINGIPVWTALAAEFTRNAVDEQGAGSRMTAWSNCPGHLAQWADAQVWPTLGLNTAPKQHDMTWDYTHPQYDDWWWRGAEHVATVATASTSWPGALWALEDGSTSLPDPNTVILGAPGDTITTAILGTRYFRKWVQIPATGEYFLFFGGDDTFTLSIDGALVIDTDQNQNFTNRNLVQISEITAGWRLFAWSVTNLNRADPSANPCGGAWELYIPGYPPTLVASTGDGITEEVVVGPNETEEHLGIVAPPGMSPGNMARLMLESVQARGVLTHWRLSCSDINDSYGVPWAPIAPSSTPNARIATKILTDLLTVVREVSGTYWDARADPRDFVLHLYNKGTMNNVASGQSFLPGANVTVLSQRGEYKPTNALVIEYNDRYLLVEDAASIAVNGRHEGRLALGAVNGDDEAERIGEQALLDYAQPREQIQVQIRGPVPYQDYDIGMTAGTIDSQENFVTERITAIAVSSIEATGGIIGTPTLRDLFFFGE